METSQAKLGDWLERAKQIAATTSLAPSIEEVGRVETVADGIALVSGLPGARLDELLRFECGQIGFALTLDRDVIGCVLFDGLDRIGAGDRVEATGDVVRVPVGMDLLGRIVDPLGRPLDDRSPIVTAALQPIERPAPAIVDRDFVSEPLQTGILVIDSMLAIGRGQRELIIGDRAIGKTTIAIDCMINQRATDLVCVYVAVGQRSSAVKRVVDAIRSHGAPEQTVFVVANSDSAPGLQWIAPFAGFTIAEYFRDSGRHALVIIDDMTKHAATHREIALLTRQPPGREAFPGDVFHVHARLLERAAKLAPAAGGGSLTALPIAELDAGNLSAYIPTNLISITDGQIVLDSRLFREGVKPAVDIGVSVSRVGGKTQSPALRAASKSLRLDFAQFLELEIFTRFGGMSDARVKEKIARGLRIRAVLNQPQFAPLPLAHQVALVTALQHGVLDLLPVERVAEFRDRLTEWLGGAAAATVERINRTGDLSQIDETELVELLARCAGELIQDAPAMRTRRSRDGTPG
jgi:F-type H+-transporting ATPase subunit alpha